MAEYTVTCQVCGAVHHGNSKLIPIWDVQRAGDTCRACGSNQVAVTPRKKKPLEQQRAYIQGRWIGAIVFLGGPILFGFFIVWIKPHIKSSSPSSGYEYCSPGLFGREC